MKRPLALVGFSITTTLLIGVFVGLDSVVYLTLFTGVMFFASFFIKNKRKKKALNLFLISVICAFVLFLLYNNAYVNPIENLSGEKASVNARLVDMPENTNGKFIYTVKTDSVELQSGRKAPQNIKLTLILKSKIEIDYCDSINLEVEFLSLNNEYKLYNNSQNIFISAQAEKDNIVVNKNDVNDILSTTLQFKENLINRIYDLMPYREATLANAILLGDKSGLDADVKNDFYTIGVSHLVVVSGLHMSVIASILYIVLMMFNKNKKTASVGAIVGVLAFMVVTGFTPSVVRSGITLIILFLGGLFTRQSNSINSMGLALIMLCAFNPYSVLDVGLQLSFTATLSIIIFYTPVKRYIYNKIEKRRKIPKILDLILSVVIVSITVVSVTLPITSIYFATLSPYFLLSNLLLVYALSLVLITLIIMLILSCVPILCVLAQWVAFVATAICRYMIFSADAIADLPYSSVNIDTLYFKIWLVVTIIIVVGFLAITRRKSSLKLTVPVSLCLFVVIVIFSLIFSNNNSKIEIINSGNGVSVVMSKGKNCAVLSSGGTYGNNNTIDYLEDFKEIDLQIIGAKKVNNAYSQEILYNKKVKTVVMLDSEKTKEIYILATNRQENVIKFKEKQKITIWNNTLITLENLNGALWQYIECENKTIVIAPPNGNFNEVDEKYSSADYIVLNGAVKNIEKCKSENVVICATTYNIEKIEEKMKKFLQGKNVYNTAEETQQIIS